LYLDHILESFEKVIQYTSGVEYDQFLGDEEKQDAVIKKLKSQEKLQYD